MKKCNRKVVISSFVVAMLNVLGWSTGVHAQTLNISNEPLYLGYNVDPNVFFELDDSGSMDWSITTVPYWDQCRYDNAHPTGSCSSSLRTDGLWRSYYGKDSHNGDGNWQPSSGSYPDSFRYVFKNSDNEYSRTVEEYELSEWTNNGRFYREVLYTKDWRIYSADFNVTYYNPELSYAPWKGTALVNGVFSQARSNPQSGQTGYSYQRDLAGNNGMFTIAGDGFVYEVWKDDRGYDDGAPNRTNMNNVSNDMVDVWDSHLRFVVTQVSGSYVLTKYEVTYTLEDVSGDGIDGKVLVEAVSAGEPVSTDGFVDDNLSVRTVDDIVENIANWYQYGRRRMFVAKNAISRVIDDNTDFRFGITVLNRTGDDSNELFVEMPNRADTDYSDDNRDLLDSLFKFPQPAKGTPLRRGLDNAGRYFSHAQGYDGTTRTSPITESCQQNFTLLFTDGFWGGSDPSTSVGDRDNDDISKTLADVALYWSDHDIDGRANLVPVSGTELMTFQHMVTYSVAFGVRGRLLDTDNDNVPDQIMNTSGGSISFAPFDPTDTVDGHAIQWGSDPFDKESGKIDDMWHAAYNSGGQFISAKNPDDLLTGLNSAMDSITQATGSSASVAASTGMYQTGTAIFLARFDSANWSGDLFKVGVEADASGNLSIPEVGETGENTAWGGGAADKLDTLVSGDGYDTKREVLSYNPESRQGVAFRFPSDYTNSLAASDLSKAQVSALVPHDVDTADTGEVSENKTAGLNLLNYLRGDRSNEDNDGNYRERAHVLGDIVESSPRYVGAPNRFYPDDIESSKYSLYRQSQISRKPILYFGANDGMLHAIEAGVDTIVIDGDGNRTVDISRGGDEVFSYVPSAVYGNLSELAKPDYSHRYFVNSSVSVNDAYFGGKWHTVLVGGLAAGGQGVYALDITLTGNLNEGDADRSVLWEFNDSNTISAIGGTDTDTARVGSDGDKHLGYTYSRPQIAKMHNGKWVAVFGNGYNNTENDGSMSSTGSAYLYVVDIETGLLLRRFTIADATDNSANPNGLSTPTLVDLEGDYLVDYIYAGDIKGNLWKFDMRSTSSAGWTVDKLFSTDTDQPITVKPAVGDHPTGSGLMIYFGTGKYIEELDAVPTNKPTQSFYAIWDNVYDSGQTLLTTRDKLLEQTIDDEVTHAGSGAEVRVTSTNAINWSEHRGWYLDIEYQSNNNGELIATDALIRGDRVVFISIQPEEDACAAGGNSWIWELDSASGARMAESPVDTDGDGVIDDSDLVSSGGSFVSGSGYKMTGIMTMPTILADANNTGQEHKVFSSSTGSTSEMTESTSRSLGRRSWRQLQ